MKCQKNSYLTWKKRQEMLNQLTEVLENGTPQNI